MEKVLITLLVGIIIGILAMRSNFHSNHSGAIIPPQTNYLPYLLFLALVSILTYLWLFQPILEKTNFNTSKEQDQWGNTRKKPLESNLEEGKDSENYFPYTIQFDEFGNHQKAEKLIRSLIKEFNEPGRIAKVVQGHQEIYRVWIGKFKTRQDAQLFIDQRISDSYKVEIVELRL